MEDAFLTTDAEDLIRRVRITVRGVVQGVGFRPFVFNAAKAQSLSGWVCNGADAVDIEVQGPATVVERFIQQIHYEHPPQAKVRSLDVREIAILDDRQARSRFEIRASVAATSPGPIVPADLATCSQCQGEIRDPQQLRYRYPFTNCTNCGPRWSIITHLPYDRPRTSMQGFTMCDDCRREYDDPGNRRFHAQPIACPKCGPALRMLGSDGQRLADGEQALETAVQVLRSGRVLAMKGLGGFQLLADARSLAAVLRLRDRKRRPDKPLAVLMRSWKQVAEHCHVSDDETRELLSPSAPILLLRRRADCTLAAALAPGNPLLGVMLPATPLHHLLMDEFVEPLVCTSGNASEEPMAIRTSDAIQRLGRIADVILTHDRPIIRPVDDSVARWTEDGLQLIRRARGFAPLPIHAPQPMPTVLATGGHLKNAVALSIGDSVVMAPHIGDLDNVLGVETHRQAISDLLSFFAVRPDAVVCDAHPDYASTQSAERLAASYQVPLYRVQHHHAHVAACMLDRDIEPPVLGFSWDGTGYGDDGTIWGGEALLCTRESFRRVAHLRPFPLPGGDRAAREPRRSALGILYAGWREDRLQTAQGWFSESELRGLASALRRPKMFPRTSSLGRLFDAVAAFCGLPLEVSFEGQAAMALEHLIDSSENQCYPLPLLSAETAAIVDWQPLIAAVLADRAASVPVGVVSARFHNALADLSVRIAQHTDCPRVALTGGCFLNAELTHRVRSRLLESGFEVYTHKQVSPGDGGLALGQILVAATQHANRAN